MNTWHTRLDEALKHRGYSWLELFNELNRKLGISKPSVYAWKPNYKNRTEMLNGDNLDAVCKFLRIRSDWLINGTGPMDFAQDQQPDRRPRRPVDPDELSDFSLIIAKIWDSLPPADADEIHADLMSKLLKMNIKKEDKTALIMMLMK